MRQKIFHVAAMTVLSVMTGQVNAEAYRCKSTDGKTVIQSWPCSGEQREKKQEKPNYVEIINCSMKDTAKRLLTKDKKKTECAAKQ